MASILDILGWRNISASVQEVSSGVPNRLPPAFLNLTEKVRGDSTTYITFYGQRQTAQQAPYGSPSKKAAQKQIGEKSVRLLHFTEHLLIQQELLLQLRQPNDLIAQEKAKDIIVRAGADFKQRFDNGRIGAITSALANAGKIWYDSSGNLLPSSSGASLTIDPGVHANNQNQLNGIIDASWATPSTNIIQHITNIKIQSRKNTGREIKHAFYGKNVPAYLFNSTTLSKYWQFYPKMYEALSASPDMVPNGFAALEWHFMGDTFFEDQNGTTQSIWGDDAVTFTPEIDRNVYTLYQGTMVAPKLGFGPTGADLIATWGGLDEIEGMGGYCIPQVDPVGMKMVYFDTCLPTLKTAAVNGSSPGDFFFADVTP